MPTARRLRPPASADALDGDPARAVRRGLALIARRPRTAADLRERLGERFEASAADAAMRRLAELGYVDDAAWAAGYVGRPRSAERGARVLRAELRARGIEDETAAEALRAHDEDAAALAAARRLARSGRNAAPEARARRLRAALARRGFAFEVIERALSTLGEERTEALARAS